jgi:hypothetical protein
MFKVWQNVSLNISLRVEYNPMTVTTYADGIVSYQVRDCDIIKTNLFGASFTTDAGYRILIINGQGLLQPSSLVYQIPPGQTDANITVPSQENSNY